MPIKIGRSLRDRRRLHVGIALNLPRARGRFEPLLIELTFGLRRPWVTVWYKYFSDEFVQKALEMERRNRLKEAGDRALASASEISAKMRAFVFQLRKGDGR